jgi:hypothetical protein
MSKTMKAAVFVSPGRIELRQKRIPEIGPDDALLRITTKAAFSPACLELFLDGTDAGRSAFSHP